MISKNNVYVLFFFAFVGEEIRGRKCVWPIQYKLAFLLYPRPPSNYHTSLELGPMSQVRTRSRMRSREDRVLEGAEFSNGWAMPLLHCALVK